MPEVITIGETMLALSPVTGPLAGAELLRTATAGAESNVAAHLADLGVAVAWASRLGADPMGQTVLRELKGRGIDLTFVEIDGVRPTGVMFKDPAPDGTAVHYLRRGSAASAIGAGFLPDSALADAAVIHISGVTVALSSSGALFVDDLLRRAPATKARVSFDVNYRAGLWDVATAAPALLNAARRADICFVGRDEAETVWGTRTADEVRELLPGVPVLVIKDGAVGATAFTAVERVFVPAPSVDVVEPVGAGDAFAAGALAGILAGDDLSDVLRRGHERAALTLTSPDDLPLLERAS